MIIYYRDTRPFILVGENGQITGIEFELIRGFQDYVKSKMGVNLTVVWKRKDTFGDVYNLIKESSETGIFGLSIFSYTDQRAREVNFSPLYMPDISVLITSDNVPIAKNETEFKMMAKNMTAITVKQTIYESELMSLKEEKGYEFDIRYVENTDDIITTIPAEENLFGYIDLPNYLIALNENDKINRQNLLPVQKKGYGVIYPISSDWKEPVEKYFGSPECALLVHNLIKKYLGSDVDHLMENIANAQNEQVILLTKEKELQSKELLEVALKVQQEVILRNSFMVGFVLIGIITIILFNRNRSKAIANRVLNEHKREIEVQRQNIKNANKQLKKRNSALEELNREKNSLIKILSHDLRAPLNNIQGLTKVFQLENDDMSEGQEKILDHIKNEAVRLNDMISKILNIEAIESKKNNVKLERIEVNSLISEVIENFDELAKNKALKLQGDIPQESIYAIGDKLYLTQVYENLLSNAIKFSDKNTTIAVNLQPVNGHVRTTISDQGPGISMEDQGKMFKKFQRLSAKPTGGEQSTGLGLSIVKKFVNDMNGNVWCESELGQGADFIVELERVD